MTNLRMITAPTAEPLTLVETRLHLRLDTSGLPPTHPEDSLVSSLITAAREIAEQFLSMALTNAVYELRVDALSDHIHLPLGPVGSVISVTYVDELGAPQTLAPALYVFDSHPDAPAILMAYNAAWPATRTQANAVVVTFQGMYVEVGSPTRPVPRAIKQAMLLLVGHLYRNREQVVKAQANEIPMGAMYLLQPYRLGMGV